MVTNIDLDRPPPPHHSLVHVSSDPLVIPSKREVGEQGEVGPEGAPTTHLTFSFVRTLSPTTSARFYFFRSATITSVLASVGTPPSGGSVVVDVQKNGVSLFTNPLSRPTINPGQHMGVGTPDIVSVTVGDYVTVETVTVGSETPGADLVVQIEYSS